MKLSKSDPVIPRMLEEEWPDFPKDEAEELTRSVIRPMNAANFLKHRFPRGVRPKEIGALSGRPFDPGNIRNTALELNRLKEKKPNIVAFR